jgi:hypothetical protein
LLDLHDVGLEPADLLAGFFGGVVNVFVMRRIKPFDAIGSVVVGALAANYLSPMMAHVTGTGPGVTAFLVGLAGMAICQGLIEAFRRWTPSVTGLNGKDKPNAP